MTKLVLDSVASGYDLSKINSNFQAIQEELQDKVLYRDNPEGEPNTLETDLDANGKSIYNLSSIQIQGYSDLGSLITGVEAAKDFAEASAIDAGESADEAQVALDQINTYRITWKGAWSGETSYQPYDAVENNGSSYIAKIASTNVTPPNSTYWSLLSARGADGGGAGDVIGPASASGSTIPIFGDVSGKLLADSGVLLSDKQDTLVSGSNIKTINGESALGSGNLVISSVPAGSVMHFAMESAPTGWLKANGAAISRTTYSDLFSAIGTAFGTGDGSTTFNLPDLRGEFLRGLDDGRGVDSSRILGSSQSSQNLSHTHTGTAASSGAHTHNTTVPQPTGGGIASSTTTSGYSASVPTYYTTNSAGAHSHSLTINADGGTESRPRNISLLICIKF